MLALAATTIVIAVLAWVVLVPMARRRVATWRVRRLLAADTLSGYDPGRERRAEQRARELLRSCVNAEEWEMYRDLGFIRVWGSLADGPEPDLVEEPQAGAPYAYVIYPHRPIVCYLPQTRRLLNEYCVHFPDETRPYGSPRLPDADDVLAKWMALTSDERRLVESANMHLPGRQLDPAQVRRDLWRLGQWERARVSHERRRAGSLPAS